MDLRWIKRDGKLILQRNAHNDAEHGMELWKDIPVVVEKQMSVKHKKRIRELEGRLRKIQCLECGGSEMKHKKPCPVVEEGDQ